MNTSSTADKLRDQNLEFDQSDQGQLSIGPVYEHHSSTVIALSFQ